MNTLNLKKLAYIGLSALAFSFLLSVRSNAVEPSTAIPVPVVESSSPTYSLDAEAVGSVDLGPVYVLEYRGSPNYRIMQFAPLSGELTEVFNVPTAGLVYGIAASPADDSLLISFTDDYTSNGNGLYSLQLDTDEQELREIIPETAGTYYVDAVWDLEGQIWATKVVASAEINDIVRIDPASGSIDVVRAGAIDPTVFGTNVAYLPLETDNSRRSIEVFSAASGDVQSVDVLGKGFDLDNLLYDPLGERVLVSALGRQASVTFGFGEAIYAHGSHSVPSSWVALEGGDYAAVDGSLGSMLVYDAVTTTDGRLLEVTNEGLYVGKIEGERELLLKSRALRFVAF